MLQKRWFVSLRINIKKMGENICRWLSAVREGSTGLYISLNAWLRG
jgi:hypothetical protein